MLVVSPTPALHLGWTSFPSVPMSSVSHGYVDSFEYYAQQAAYDRAVSRARAEAMRRHHQQELRRQQLEQQRRRQAALEALEQQAMLDVLETYYDRMYSARQAKEQAYRRQLAHEQERRRIAYAAQERERYALARDAQLEEDFLSALGLRLVHGEMPKTRNLQRPSPIVSVPPKAVDVKGKGKVVDRIVPEGSNSTRPHAAPTSLDDILQNRFRAEADPEIKAILENVFNQVFGTSTTATNGPSTSGTTHDDVKPASASSSGLPTGASKPEPESATTSGSQPSTASAQAPPLHRTPALSPRAAAHVRAFIRTRRARHTSLSEIAAIESALHALEAQFILPSHLDFESSSDSDTLSVHSSHSENDLGLLYTPANTPVHAHTHALDALLVRLDAVASAGDAAVRGRRREVVRMVENAIGEVRRRVEESRERAEQARAEDEKTVEDAALVQDAAVPAAAQVDGGAVLEENAQESGADAVIERTADELAPIPVVEEVQPTTEAVEDALSTLEPEHPAANSDSSPDAPEPPTPSDLTTINTEQPSSVDSGTTATDGAHTDSFSMESAASPEVLSDVQERTAPTEDLLDPASLPTDVSTPTDIAAPSSPSPSASTPEPTDSTINEHLDPSSLSSLPVPASPLPETPAFLSTLPSQSLSHRALPSTPAMRSRRSFVEDVDEDEDEDGDEVEVIRHEDAHDGEAKDGATDEWEEVLA